MGSLYKRVIYIRFVKTPCVIHQQVGLDFTPRVVSSDAGKDQQRQVLIRQDN